MPRKKPELKPTELQLLKCFSQKPQLLSQREIARRSGLSVGFINAAIRNLMITGYLKASRMNRRSIQYLLTSRGFAEKALKSYAHILHTVRSYSALQDRLERIVRALRKEGVAKFYLHGDGEMADLISSFFREEGWELLQEKAPRRAMAKAVLLNVAPHLRSEHKGMRVIDLITELDDPSLQVHAGENLVLEMARR